MANDESRIAASRGVRHAQQLAPDDGRHRQAYVGTHGLGPVTWAYFSMLLGHPGVKADTWVLRFVQQALRRSVTANEAEQLVAKAADVSGCSPTDLDYAIWSHIRRKR